MNRQEAIKLQTLIVSEKSGHYAMQTVKGGYLYGNDVAIVRIDEELAVLGFLPELRLDQLFNIPDGANPAVPTMYRARIGGDIGTAVKFIVPDDNVVWINQSYYNLVKKLADTYKTDGKRLYVLDETGLIAVISRIRNI